MTRTDARALSRELARRLAPLRRAPKSWPIIALRCCSYSKLVELVKPKLNRCRRRREPRLPRRATSLVAASHLHLTRPPPQDAHSNVGPAGSDLRRRREHLRRLPRRPVPPPPPLWAARRDQSSRHHTEPPPPPRRSAGLGAYRRWASLASRPGRLSTHVQPAKRQPARASRRALPYARRPAAEHAGRRARRPLPCAVGGGAVRAG